MTTMYGQSGFMRLQTMGRTKARTSGAAVLRFIVAQHVQGLRLAVVGLAILVYLAVDGVMLVQHETHIQWDMSVHAHGIITWVDPNGPANVAGLQAGDQVLPPPGAAATAAALDRQPM